MLIQHKTTFKDFSSSSEGIAPGILSSRLKWLEGNKLVTKQKLPDNQKENIYLLTEKGIAIAPIITEIVLWSIANLDLGNEFPQMITDKTMFTETVQNGYRQFAHALLQ